MVISVEAREPYWTPRRDWAGKVVAVVAGGPSLAEFDLSPLQAVPTIAVNNAWRIAPWAACVYFADARWWRWYRRDLRTGFAGRIVTSAELPRTAETSDVLRLRRSRVGVLPRLPHEVVGRDSGYQAITLAVALGARRIVLAGFDMRFADDGRAHWHSAHPSAAPELVYRDKFAPAYGPLRAALLARGVGLVRITPSALACVPEWPLAKALGLDCAA